MNLIGILPARNEDWILGLTARALLMWCDKIIVLNHASTDGTLGILSDIKQEWPTRLVVLDEPSREWREMEHRQRLLWAAREHEATHIAIVDADEMLTGNLLPYIRRWIGELQPGQILPLPWVCVWRRPDQYRCDDFVRTNDTASVAFRDKDILCWMAADGYQHHHREPYGVEPYDPSVRGVHPEMKHLIIAAGGAPTLREGRFNGGGLLHFQFVDWPRLQAKQALYKLNEIVRWPGKMTAAEIERMYNPTLSENGLETRPMSASWLEPYQHIMKHLVLGGEPWQAVEARRLWQQYGADHFRGITTWGVCQW